MAGSDPRATFAVVLDDQTSGSANNAAQSLENLRDKIDADTKALSQMRRALRNLKGGTSTSAAAFKDLQDKIAAQRAQIAASQESYLKLGGTFDRTKTKAVQASGGLQDLLKQAAGTSGPVGALGGAVSRMGAALANPVVLVAALAAGLTALAVATAAATAALLKYGVAQSGARREEALRLEGLNSLWRQFGRTTASVGALQHAIDKAEDSTNLGRDTLGGYARQLARAGLRGDALADAVEAMGIAAQVQGDRGAARFRALAINARLTGRSVKDLAEDYRNRLGPIATRQLLSIDNQAAKLRKRLSRIFSGLRIEGFLRSLDRMLSLFSQSTASGRALKRIVEIVFQPFLDALETVGPVARRFFQGMIIAALKLRIFVLKLEIAFIRAFGRPEFLKNIDGMGLALKAGIVFFGLATVAVVALAAAFVALGVGMLVPLAFIFALPAAIIAIGLAIGAGLQKAIDFFEETDFKKLGQSVIDGLIEGIENGINLVKRTVTNLATTAKDAFKSALGIASPSRVFADFGANVSQGVVRGIDSGQASVDESVAGIAAPPSATGLGVGAGASITFGDINVQVSGGEQNENSAREIALALRDEIAALLEGVSIELGGSVV